MLRPLSTLASAASGLRTWYTNTTIPDGQDSLGLIVRQNDMDESGSQIELITKGKKEDLPRHSILERIT
jgi:hypothetical protein